MQYGRKANGIAGCILFLGCLMASTVAHSAEYYFCYVLDARGEKLLYHSDILLAGTRIDDMETLQAFRKENELRSTLDFGHIPDSGNCISELDLSEVRTRYRRILETYPEYPRVVHKYPEYRKSFKNYSYAGRKYPFTRPPVPSKPVVSDPSPVPAIIIEETKPVTPTPKQLAEQAALEREAASKRARNAAAGARYDAKVQAAIAEQLRLRKLQGARQ